MKTSLVPCGAAYLKMVGSCLFASPAGETWLDPSSPMAGSLPVPSPPSTLPANRFGHRVFSWKKNQLQSTTRTAETSITNPTRTTDKRATTTTYM